MFPLAIEHIPDSEQSLRPAIREFIVRVPCCDSKENADAAIGTNLRANVQDDITING